MDVQPNPTAENPPVKPQPPKRHPEKITQMQCLQTNYELNSFFIHSLSESFKYLPKILQHIYLQLQLLVNFLQYRLTVSENLPHPGDLLQNIKFTEGSLTPKKKLLYLFLTVIFPYLHKRLQTWLLRGHEGWRERLHSFIIKIEKIVATLEFIHLSIFIYKGKYRTITQRILKIPMQFADQKNMRILDFSLMNRKMIWSIYELFLKTLIPYGHGQKMNYCRFFSRALKNIFYLNSYMQIDHSDNKNCMVCSESPVMPMRAQCGHISCYYCMKTELDEEQVACRLCSNSIRSWKNLYE